MAVRENSNSHRNQIFEQTRQLIRERGFNNTSIADIAVGCGLSKASIYHYIHEKDDLVDMSVQSVQAFFKENAFNLIHSDILSEEEKVEVLFKALEQYLKDYEGGCLVRNLLNGLVVDVLVYYVRNRESYRLRLEKKSSTVIKLIWVYLVRN